ncbi:hypothetical protein HOLleu_10528 [Holothuria leucospilota]|uniref:Uncharacterized protein n=1 Tax=Holothuria leucospilota TaxID=206669 RepID=A0A9Q1CE73_HOLLE|nr:hypothetical protein HOLleu_10528 [Holothuria leucospilota]
MRFPVAQCRILFSYTLMDAKTQQIMNTELVQVTDNSSSTAMEKMGFEMCVDKIEANNIKVALVATDRHAGIRKRNRTKYPHIEHNFDVWRFVKSLKKLLAKTKDSDDLTPFFVLLSELLKRCQNVARDVELDGILRHTNMIVLNSVN